MEKLKKQLEDIKGALPLMIKLGAIDQSAYKTLDEALTEALQQYAVVCSVFRRPKTYNETDVEILMNQLSSYLTTRELIDLHRDNFMEWTRKRDWFIKYTIKKLKDGN